VAVALHKDPDEHDKMNVPGKKKNVRDSMLLISVCVIKTRQKKHVHNRNPLYLSSTDKAATVQRMTTCRIGRDEVRS